MWNGFIGQRIAATTKNQRRLGVCLELAALALALYRAQTFVNVIQRRAQLTDDLVLVAVLVLAGLWALIWSKQRSENPERHPLCKALSVYGPLYTLVPEIDAEFSAAHSILGGVTSTRNWVISCGLMQSFAMHRGEIVWVYKKRTKHSVNFIPTGTTYSLILRDARGKIAEISSSEQDVNTYLSSLAQQTPWIIFGYDRKIAKLYKKDLQAFAQAVSQQRAEMKVART